MNIKETWENLPRNQKKNIYYWLSLILAIDVVVAAQNIFKFAQSGLCRNYMVFGSQLHACSLFEFIKNGWAWLSFTNVLIFLPAAALMIFATQIVDAVFAKKK